MKSFSITKDNKYLTISNLRKLIKKSLSSLFYLCLICLKKIFNLSYVYDKFELSNLILILFSESIMRV